MKNEITAAICVLNSKYIHSSLAPWCLSAGVDAYCVPGITAEVVEGTINERLEAVAQRILALNPQVIGFSCYIWNISATKRLIHLVKNSLPRAVIVLGGPEVSYCAEKLLNEEPLVQYVISGEGERPFALLLNAVSRGDAAENIPGVCFRRDGRAVIVPPHTPEEDPPSPYTPKYLDALKGRIAYLEASRGCPYSCAFCLSGRCGSARFFDLDRAKQELLLLARSGAKTVKLVDRTFNANRRRANELFRFIIQNYGNEIPAGVCFHFEIAGDILDEDTLNLLAQAPKGAMQLEIGLQSFNPKTLAAINRKTDVERLKKNILRLIANANMHIHIDLIAGLPYEDLASFAESFNIAYGLNPNMLQLGFLKLLYGAPMRENPEEFPCSYDSQPPYEITRTPWLSEEELLNLHRTEDALERLYNSGRFPRTLAYLLKESGMTPFELFGRFGAFAAQKGTERIPLDEYIALVFTFFSGQNGIDKEVLRDKMVRDRLSTNASGKLPPILYVRDPSLGKAVRELENEFPTPKGVKRGCAILYSEHCLAYADYQNRNPINGEFYLKEFYPGTVTL
ncbi:B12-binding domain-containing radical SAM protein [Caproiciproducens faecalis]|uniref:DUF4080 domain-containing protein n=1 Tax=Caproiciproducens faecalis TaxID=2820301 RepID=A0ABS7DJI6_9FIRM|nr:B12-binding domain-containing radical SAM protein [Caproiciproducens faecalis]MBW7571388.1 DUF4080 domain-containing protein [Caproiciproducens faecalis]